MITIDPQNFTINSDASILDLPALHQTLRDWEDSEQGAIHPVTHSWKALDLGGGGFFYQADLLPPWVLKFPNAGNYTITYANGSLTVTPAALTVKSWHGIEWVNMVGYFAMSWKPMRWFIDTVPQSAASTTPLSSDE